MTLVCYLCFRNYAIKYKVVEVKQGEGPWTAYVPPDRDVLHVHEPSPSYSSTLEGISKEDKVVAQLALATVESECCTYSANHYKSDACEVDMLNSQQQNSSSVHKCEEKLQEYSDFDSVNSVNLTATGCNLEFETANKFNTSIPEAVISSVTDLEPHLASETNYEVSQSVVMNDPAHYANSRITSTTISLLINNPCQPEMDCKFDSINNRRFLPAWFSSTLPDGACKKRHWLSYSKSTNLAYCIDCMLFGGPTANVTWARDGYSGWINGHGLRGIETHEGHQKHKDAELGRFRWIHNQRIDRKLSQENTLLIEQNRRVAVVAVKAIKYLAKEMMALRGHDSNSGKFLNLFSLLAEFEPSATAYLEKLASRRSRETGRKPEVNILSPRNIRRLVKTMKELVVKKISDTVGDQGAFSLIVDGTQDASKLEAVSVLIRYIESHAGKLRPTERLLDVFTTGDTSGEALCRRIVAILTAQRINLNWMIGQSYDGAGNMRGQFSGLKTRILEHAKRAIYVWCRAHRLNLVIESMLKCCTLVVGTIGLVQELYNFFTGHKRHAVLVELQKDQQHAKTLKRVSDTTRSWRSAEDGVNTLLDCFQTVTAALDKLSNESKDTATVSSAIALEKRLQDFPVIVCLFLLRTVFVITGPVSRLLQGVAVDLSISAMLLQGVIKSLQVMRDKPENSWSKLLSESTSFAQKYNILPVFPEKRMKKVKKMPGELAEHEPIASGEQAFRTSVFIPVLDTLIMQLQDRFSLNETKLMMQMHLFAPSSLLNSSSVVVENDIHELCINYSLDATAVLKELTEFRHVYSNVHHMVKMDDLLPIPVSSETKSYAEAVQTQSLDVDEDDEGGHLEQAHISDITASPVTATKRSTWIDHSFIKPLRVLSELSGFVNLSCMYKNLASLAITSCSAERTMSKVKIVKGNLRSTMLDDWFSSLLVIAAEKDLLDSLHENEIIDKFARCSLPLQKHLIYGFHV